MSSWKRNTTENRHRALVVGGSASFFVLLAAGAAALIQHGIIDAPYVVSFPFAALLLAMAFELGFDLLRAGQVAQRLRTSEAALQESEDRFRTMADATPVLIWMSGEDKLCTFFNKAWLEFTGRKMEQEVGNGWTGRVHPDDFERCFETYASAFDARRPFVMQYRLKRYDGEYRSLTDQGVPRYGAHGDFRGYIGVCVDITDLLKQEKALHQIEERVALAAEAAQLGVWELNVATNRVWVSDKIREIFQLDSGDEITYEQFQERVHPDDRAAREATMQRAVQEKISYETEFRIVLPNGNIRWITGRARWVDDADGKPCRLLGVSMDATKRKEAEELFRLATEGSPNGMLLIDEQGRIVLVNGQIEKLFGYKRDELVGRRIEVLLPDGYAAGLPAHQAKFIAARTSRTLGAEKRLRGRRANGTEFPIEVGLNPIATEKGNLVMATVVDISERMAAEEEARRHHEQINRFSRASLLGEMTAALAHELNQPLSAIVSNADAGMRFIDSGKCDPQMLREILLDVEADGRRADNIIRNVRSTIKKGSAVRNRIELNDVVTKVKHIVQSEATARSCEVSTSLADDLPPVEANLTQIQQVLINLVGNAFDAMNDTPVSNRKVELTTEHNGNDTVRVAVRDHGIGIPNGSGEQIFEQFFTTKEEGLGMGLAIARSIIEAHGGDIAAENMDGDGARFSFTLPAGDYV